MLQKRMKLKLLQRVMRQVHLRYPEKKMVKRRLFKDNDKYQADVFVCVNGKAYTIKRGVDVEIPEEVAEVLDNADDQLMVAAQKMDELTYRDPK